MAKIKVFGQVCVVTSSMKKEDLKQIQKYRPEALVLKDGDEPIFKICCTTRGAGSIDRNGAVFAGETRDENKLATITMGIPDGVEDVEEFVAEELGLSVINLNKLEETLPAVLEEIAALKAKIRENIEVL